MPWGLELWRPPREQAHLHPVQPLAGPWDLAGVYFL